MSKLQNVKTKIQGKASKLYFWAAAGLGTVVGSVSQVMALAVPKNNINPDTIIGGAADQILDIFRYIGFILAIWGIGQLVLAFKNEDADSKSRAIMVLVAAILLIGMKTLVEAIL